VTVGTAVGDHRDVSRRRARILTYSTRHRDQIARLDVRERADAPPRVARAQAWRTMMPRHDFVYQIYHPPLDRRVKTERIVCHWPASKRWSAASASPSDGNGVNAP
jgi:hypothetical protein